MSESATTDIHPGFFPPLPTVAEKSAEAIIEICPLEEFDESRGVFVWKHESTNQKTELTFTDEGVGVNFKERFSSLRQWLIRMNLIEGVQNGYIQSVIEATKETAIPARFEVFEASARDLLRLSNKRIDVCRDQRARKGFFCTVFLLIWLIPVFMNTSNDAIVSRLAASVWVIVTGLVLLANCYVYVLCRYAATMDEFSKPKYGFFILLTLISLLIFIDNIPEQSMNSFMLIFMFVPVIMSMAYLAAFAGYSDAINYFTAIRNACESFQKTNREERREE